MTRLPAAQPGVMQFRSAPSLSVLRRPNHLLTYAVPPLRSQHLEGCYLRMGEDATESSAVKLHCGSSAQGLHESSAFEVRLCLVCAEVAEKKDLFGPLPDVELDGSSRSGRDSDLDRRTYPTHLATWHGFSSAVKTTVARLLPVRSHSCWLDQGQHIIFLRLKSLPIVAESSTACTHDRDAACRRSMRKNMRPWVSRQRPVSGAKTPLVPILSARYCIEPTNCSRRMDTRTLCGATTCPEVAVTDRRRNL